MKTPREILLGRHQTAKPVLDSIRRQVLAKELHRSESTRDGLEFGWLQLAWQQLVLPCRTAWAGLAAAWVVVLLLRLAAGEPAQLTQSPAAKPTGATRAQLNQQWLLRAELLGIATVRPEPPAAGPGPQSEALPVRTTSVRQEETATV
jgi:hypothetical protein